MQIKLDQYKAAKEVRETLEDDTKPVEEQLKNFSAAHQKNMPIFKQRRTEAYDKFCKIIGSVLLCATVVGAFFVPKLWKTKGHKYENKINPVLKSMAAAN